MENDFQLTLLPSAEPVMRSRTFLLTGPFIFGEYVQPVVKDVLWAILEHNVEKWVFITSDASDETDFSIAEGLLEESAIEFYRFFRRRGIGYRKAFWPQRVEFFARIKSVADFEPILTIWGGRTALPEPTIIYYGLHHPVKRRWFGKPDRIREHLDDEHIVLIEDQPEANRNKYLIHVDKTVDLEGLSATIRSVCARRGVNVVIAQGDGIIK
ncbi:MAG: hypothetical protein FJ319_08380 [SAR202 cluster bacterium]|nr:hypothetical protein [SAR202 cluster bacterium]